ncbi:hypothetical protein SESBI_39262 [Sesbania bispinosa]|nr:hypothetical protein SESBI_39262 [Sesbania bispinosa]
MPFKGLWLCATDNNDLEKKATKDLQVKGKFVNPGKQIIGSVPRVEVGDEFLYWREFNVVGLHRQITRGIYYVNVNGMLLATSIVSGGVYDDDVEDTNELVYMGEGGNVIKRERKPKDQKLNGVDKYWHEKWLHGKLVYKFKFKRMPDQVEVPWNELKKSQSLEGREGLCVNDISYGKELIPIYAINTVDYEGPPMFEYMTRMVYPNLCNPIPYVGCDCVDGSSDSMKCSCVERNMGKIPFNGKKATVVGRPNCIVYECGPSYKCPPTCQNKISQHGIQFRFEIFKTKTKGWGVRSLNSIPSGSLICEYTGELIEFEEAKNRANNDEYIFDIGNNYSDDTPWEELSTIIPDIGLSSSSQVIKHGSFTIDAAHRGNFGRFINHNCSPNLFAQIVLYNHDDNKILHIMLFTDDNIPRMQELTYNYNYKIDQVCGADGNIRKKNCYCGALECTGRMY